MVRETRHFPCPEVQLQIGKDNRSIKAANSQLKRFLKGHLSEFLQRHNDDAQITYWVGCDFEVRGGPIYLSLDLSTVGHAS
jgi:hypothetical protein